MKRKINSLLISFIQFGIGFLLAEKITSLLGIEYQKFLSLEFAIYIIIATVCISISESLFYKITDKFRARKNK
ncbi:hypothetical protein [Clostridium grantii]|uniref:Uncharacterized protein n=1 Tax=Clostridium grantii DSM 8605 TaxID=1121316 RepID=A0A1M5Y2N8_9CLOT|nr:hypothetical protein [Clostridium grantii]SHI06307.1 hypothetical protein SAMN02745207_04146 [Clostridium grantii DSM 8605]